MSFHPNVGDCFSGWLTHKATLKHDFYYVAVEEDAANLEWLHHNAKQRVKEAFLNEKIEIPGFRPMVHAAKDMVEPPPMPQLHLLCVETTNGSDKPHHQLHVPQSLIAQWHSHDEFGSEFRQWLDAFTQDTEAHTLKGARRLKFKLE